MKATERPPCHLDETDWAPRCRLAQSILNHREPSPLAARLAMLALTGASITDMLEVDAFARITAAESGAA